MSASVGSRQREGQGANGPGSESPGNESSRSLLQANSPGCKKATNLRTGPLSRHMRIRRVRVRVGLELRLGLG